jgi:hypothetical protein
VYKVVYKIFETDAVKIVKLTIRPIGHRHPRSSSVPHVDTGPVSSIFGMLPGSPFLSECQAFSTIRPVSPQWYQTGVLSASGSFLEIEVTGCQMRGVMTLDKKVSTLEAS